MWNKHAVFIAAAMFILFSLGCKSSKKIIGKTPVAHITRTGNDALQNLLKNIQANENTFDYYQCRSKLIYTEGEQKQELDAIITMEKDRYVLFSISAVLGLNVARVLATPDSVVVLDLLHRKAIIAGYDYLQKITQLPLTFAQLQNLIAGNALYFHDSALSLADTVMPQLTITQPLAGNRAQAVTYAMNTLKPTRTKLWERNGTKEIIIDYSNPHIYKSSAFPARWNINIQSEKNIQFELEATQFIFDKKKELVFSIPKSFELVKF
jgi:hypothetical protein